MAEKKKKRFLKCSVRAIDGSYGEFFIIDINKDDFNSFPVNDQGYVRLTMSKFKDGPNQYGNTHYIVHNDYVKPQQDGEGAVAVEEDEDLPF